MTEDRRLRVVTMNVLGPANPGWERRRVLLASTLQALDADVVALQEVPIGSAPGIVEELLGPGWHVRQLGRPSDDGVGAVLATRAPHRPVLELDQRIRPAAEGMQFWRGLRSLDGVSVCYQDAWETVHPHDPGHTVSSDNPLVRAGEVATAVSRRIDHVLVRAGAHGPTLQVRACDRVLDRPVDSVWASDHFGVVADLALPDHPPGSWGRV